VAVRVPGHEQARELIRRAGCPIAAPSANLFGQVSPTTAAHVAEQLAERIDLILDGGPCWVGVESTVVDLTGHRPVVLRPGGVTIEELERVCGPIAWERGELQDGESKSLHPAAPGMLPQHYAPRTPLLLKDSGGDWPVGPQLAALGFRAVPQPERYLAVEVLSPTGNLREAAAGFFAAVRRLDRSGAAMIVAEPFPEVGLGVALNDRLRRAATIESVAT
jgi:L-threonylcarbamoyladenylate synthase